MFIIESKALVKEIAIDLEVIKVERYKGFITLNDSIVLSANLLRINPDKYVNRYERIGMINSKYHLSKSANSDTLVVLKDYETLIYKLFKKESHWLKRLLDIQ